MRNRPELGFSAIELVVVVFVFTLLTGVTFALLNATQQRFSMESQVLDQFQGARLALDQMTRDIHDSGYPPLKSLPPAIAALSPQLAAYPFAWDPGYPAAPCTVGAGCANPSGFDLILETDIDPENANGVEWIRYSLQGTTLFRAVVTKTVGANPVTATQAAIVPYVENVVNNVPAAQMNFLRTYYPSLFPGNQPVPVFSYRFDPSKPNTAQYIRDVNITLIVQAPRLDPRTAQPRVVTLTGLVRRLNPS